MSDPCIHREVKAKLSHGGLKWGKFLLHITVMYQSTATPLPPGKACPHVTCLFSVPGEWGIWFVSPSWRWGFELCLGVMAKIELEVPSFFFFLAPKSLTAINTINGGDNSICERLAYKRSLQKLCCIFEHTYENWRALNINYFGLSQCRFFMQLVTLWLYPTFVSAGVFRTAVNSKRKKSNTIEWKPANKLQNTLACHSNNIPLSRLTNYWYVFKSTHTVYRAAAV